MTTEAKTKTAAEFILPASVVSKVDLSRLISEVEWVDNELTVAMVRAKTTSQQQAGPVISPVLADFLSQNQLELDNSGARSNLVKQLRVLKDKVPVIHMTFAVQADSESLQKLAAWLRSSVHPQAVISVGLQPGLVAGVYLRTPNHVHDLSVRGLLAAGHDVLVEELNSLIHPQSTAPSAPQKSAAAAAPAPVAEEAR